MYNLKEIAVKCETVEQKKLVAKIMSEELNYEVTMSDYSDFNYICSSPYMTIKNYVSAPTHTIIPYSDFIKQYPKHLIQSGDVVEHSAFGTMRVVLLNSNLVAVGINKEDSYTLLDDYTDSLEYDDWSIISIIRPINPRELFYMEGTTIWQRKSEIYIKREEMQSQIEVIKKELEELK